jgi:predicted O-linked N-acetylglucosamine transferase (SPINDLY family)
MTDGAVREAFEQAVKHHRQNELESAERLYRQVLLADAQHADALHLLGVATLQLGRQAEAFALINQAIELRPEAAAYRLSLGQVHAAGQRLDDSVAAYRQATVLAPDLVDAWFGLGVALQAVDRQQEATEVYRRLLELQPDHVDAYNNLGSAHELCGQLDVAVALYRRALELEPARAATYNNLASALYRCGRLEEAIVAGRQALSLKPDSATACNNLGCALTASRQFNEAVDALRRALALRPEFAEAWYNLAKALKEQGKFDEAAAAYRRTIELQPDRVEAQINLGNILQTRGEHTEAVRCYRQALALRPDDVEAYNNLGNALRSGGQLDQAIAAFRQCVRLRPEFHIAHCNLGNALKDVGHIDEAVACYRRAVELCPSDVISHSNFVYAVYYHPDYDSAAILQENRRWNAMHAGGLGDRARPHDNDPDPNRRLRIGYVGSDFRDHCQSLFTIPLFSRHDREPFEIFCYSNVPRPDPFTDRLRQSADCWRDTSGRTDEEVAEQVRADRIDILVDLTMHMSNGRPLLLARKPAPVQVAYLAYPGTTGLSAVDYRLTDPFLDPPGETDADYAERSFRLPETFWCYDPLADQPKPNSLPAINEGRITFGCFNNFCKVANGTLALWSRVLEAIAGSRLVLLSPQGEHRERVRQQFRRGDIDPTRIEFVEHRPRANYLELYHRIDMSLDTLPYNGHTTSLDSLWMGVPVVTRVGRTVVGRAGYSQLSNLGLLDLVAWSDDQFVSIASELARDLTRLAQLRSTLRDRMEHSPLMDAAGFARNIESAYRFLWRQWCQSRQSTDSKTA